MLRRVSARLALCVGILTSGCGESDDTAGGGGSAGSAGAGGANGADGGTGWRPGVVYETARAPNARGLIDRRGLIHAHSVYSHDACDGAPREGDTGPINQPCFDDFRAALCRVHHDYVMLSDHNTSFGDAEYPDVALYRADRGDSLIERGGTPVANRAACADAWQTLILPGTESATMSVGIEGHVSADVAERHTLYGDDSEPAIARLKAQNAVVLMAHTENWTADQLSTMSLDGYEMYNLHANLFRGAGAALGLISRLRTPELLPQSDLVLLPIISEDPRYLETWGSVAARGVHRTTTMGTDCHQNTFPQLLPDGERIDGYRRMMQWFSNHLLLRAGVDGPFDDRALKEALRAGRLYGSFDVMGYPVGFDFHAEAGSSISEMGDDASIAGGARLLTTLPQVQNLDPSATPPEVVQHLLKAREGGWDEVASGSSDLGFSPTEPGAYRVEVRMKPRHLHAYLADYVDLAEKDFVWIYSNPIYVVP